jgi:hypothetical protein
MCCGMGDEKLPFVATTPFPEATKGKKTKKKFWQLRWVGWCYIRCHTVQGSLCSVTGISGVRQTKAVTVWEVMINAVSEDADVI